MNRQSGGTPTAGPLDVLISKNADGNGMIALYWVSDPIGTVTANTIYRTTANTATIILDVVTANADITWVQSKLIVMDSGGLDNGNAGVTTGSSVLSTTGVHTLIMTSPNAVITGIQATDRFCLMFMFDNAQAHSSSSFQVAGADQFIAWNDDKKTAHGYTEMRAYGLSVPTSELGSETFATNFSNGRGVNQFDEVDLRERIGVSPQNIADVVGTDIIEESSSNDDTTKEQAFPGHLKISVDGGA